MSSILTFAEIIRNRLLEILVKYIFSWQQSEDVNRKKEIRSQLYKLRESRLRDLYQGDIMADNSVAGFGKDPLITSHGDALADQSFQSLKSKEVRDSLSPTEMKFQSMALNNPNTTGWNVQTSKEVSPDGRGFRAETIATTDGVENIKGGIAEFKGRNEELSSAHHQGDDKNFIKKAMETSNSHLQEKVVIGDENCGRTEVRTSSTKSTSSSQVIQSSTNVEYDDGIPIKQQAHPQKYLMDTNFMNQQDLQPQHPEQQRVLDEQRIYEQQFQQQQRQQHINEKEHHSTEQLSTTRQAVQQKNITQNIQTQETNEQNKRYVDMDKASPEYQQHVQHLMQQPGEIISNTVEYPKPNVKMITTVKRLPDGTIVRNKRYETEELPPTTAPHRPTSNAPNQTQFDRDSQQPRRNYKSDLSPRAKPTEDMVDNGSNPRYVQDTHTDEMERKYSSIKKSNSKFSTQSTSETIQEMDEHRPHDGPSSRPKPKTNDFSTHGFPSVRADKPTQEYPTERPNTAQPNKAYETAPSTPNASVVPNYINNNDNITERRINTKDGDVIIVSSAKQQNFKSSTNSERIVETEHVIHDDQPYQQIQNKTHKDFSTHGFPSVRQPNSHEPKNYPHEKQMHPHEQDFPLDKLPPGARTTHDNLRPGDEEVVVVTSQKSHVANRSTNFKRVIEHEVINESQPGNQPSIQPIKNNGIPQAEFPGSPKKPTNAEYSTQEFPEYGESRPYNDYSTPTPTRPAAGLPSSYNQHPISPRKSPSPDYSTHGFPSVRSPKGTPNQGYPSNVDTETPNGTRNFPGSSTKPTNADYDETRPYNDYPVSAPSRPAAGLPSSYTQHPKATRQSPGHDNSTHGFPSVRSPSKGTPNQGYPSNVDTRSPNGTREKLKSTPTIKTQGRAPSPNKYKTPNATVRESTERIIKKEKEVDSAHRAFAASLRSSSPIDHNRRDSYTTDSHTRHTSRSSVSSTKTPRRDILREGSHDSAPSETSRISTSTITRNTPPRTVGGRTVVTKVVTNKSFPGSNDSLNVTSPRATKSPSPSPGKSIITTTTTTRTLTRKDVPKATDNQHTRITTNKIDTLFPINEPPLTSITKKKLFDNHKQPHKQTKNIRKSHTPVINETTDSASADVAEAIEAPCLKKHYYKLGPSDQIQAPLNTTRTTSQPFKSSQIYEKSPTKKQPSQPAPTSRSSTPSLNNRKPQTPVMADDYDDENLSTSPFSSPSARTETPRKIAPNNDNNDKPRDNWQTPRRPDNDERRTVNREKTFEDTAPRKPVSVHPNAEWVVVDDVDVYDNNEDDDDGSYAPEVIDAKLNVKNTTTKLITHEKETPGVQTHRERKPTTNRAIVTTKQFRITPSQTKPNDKSPLKIKPNDSRPPQQIRTNKTLTANNKSPVHSSSEPKNVSNKPVPKDHKNSVPSYMSPLRKQLQKTTTEETTLKQNLKTSQVIKGKTTKVIETEKPKRKPLSPERKIKPQHPGKGKPSDLETTEVTRNYFEPVEPKQLDSQSNPKSPYDDDDDSMYPQTPVDRKPQHNDYNELHEVSPDYKHPKTPEQGSPRYLKTTEEDHEPNHLTTGMRKPQDTDKQPRNKSPALRKPPSPGFQKLQSTFDERSPHFGKPSICDDETINGQPYNTTVYQRPANADDVRIVDRSNKQQIVEKQNSISETTQRTWPGGKTPKRPNEEPKQHNEWEPTAIAPGYNIPEDIEEPYQGSPYDGKPSHDTNYEQYQEKEIITGTKTPKRPDEELKQRTPAINKPQYSEWEPTAVAPGYERPEDAEEPHKGSPYYGKPLQDTTYERNANLLDQKKVPKKETPKTSPPSVEKKPAKSAPFVPHNKPLDTDHELYTTKTEFDLLETNDDEYSTKKDKFITTSQKTVAKHIQKFETNVKKPQKKISEPQKLPKSAVKESSPTRVEKKPQTTDKNRPEIKPKISKPVNEQLSDTEEEEICVAFEKLNYHDKEQPKQRLPKEPVHTGPESIKRVVSPTRNKKTPGQKEPTYTNSKSPERIVSPTRIQKVPNQTIPKEPGYTGARSPERNQKATVQKLTVRTGSKSPDRVVSPTRNQNKPQEPYGREHQSPKYVSPNRIQKQAEPVTAEEEPHDKEFFSSSIEMVTSSAQKRIVNEKQITEFEEPLYPERKSPQQKPNKVGKLPTREDSPTRTQNKYGQTPGKRPESPNKPGSPTRIQRKPTQTLQDIDKSKVCEEKIPLRKGVRPEKEPKDDDECYQKMPLNTKNYEASSEVREYVINSKEEQITTVKNIQDFDDSPIPHATKFQRDSKSPIKAVLPTKESRPQSPNKYVSPTRRSQTNTSEVIATEDNHIFTTSFIAPQKIVKEYTTKEVDNEEYKQIINDNKSPTRECISQRPQSPFEASSPTPNKTQFGKNDESIKTTSRITKTVTDKTTREVEYEQYPEDSTPYTHTKDKPKERNPFYEKPTNDEVHRETSKNITGLKIDKVNKTITQEAESPMGKFSPTEDLTITYQTEQRPQSPNKNQKQPTIHDKNVKTTLETATITTTGKTIKKEIQECDYPQKSKPHKTNDKPQTRPEEYQPNRVNPFNNEKAETLPDTKKRYQEFEELRMPSRDDSTTPNLAQQLHKPNQYPTPMHKKPIGTPTEKSTEITTPYEEKPREFTPAKNDRDETFIETTEFVYTTNKRPNFPDSQKPDEKPHLRKLDFEVTDTHNTASQTLIETEQKTSETDMELYRPTPKNIKTGKLPEESKESPIRSTSPKSKKPKSVNPNDETFKKLLRTTDLSDTDEEETGSVPTDDLLTETCEKSYMIEKTFIPQEPGKITTVKKVATTETIEDQTFPEDAQEPWLPKKVPKAGNININVQLIESERTREENPDGAFISKTSEPSAPTSPTFKKKGAGRSDTFEERCRQILGMESYGDTPGSYKEQTNTEVERKKTIAPGEIKTMPVEDDLHKTTKVFQVKIEDCDEEDEPFSINSVKKTLHKQVKTAQKPYNKPLRDDTNFSTAEAEKIPIKPATTDSKETFVNEKHFTKKEDKLDIAETFTETTTLHKTSPKTKLIDETEPETEDDKYVRETKNSEIIINKKTSPKSPSPRSNSPTKGLPTTRSQSPIKGPKDAPQHKSDIKKKSPKKPDGDTTTIKDRLRATTRKQKSTLTTDGVDGSESSPEHSPTRYTERRRSSNISVTTEIIIEHTDSDTPNKTQKSPAIDKKSQDSVYKEIIDSTILPEKLTRRMPVTERKESAPVHRVTSKDKDSKMSRSTSENLIKIKKPDQPQTTPVHKTPTKTTDHRRPNKCFATKSINLSATDRLINTGEIEIDIQHAKSSREPSPDKIVPTPVPAHLDTGKPRYPDVVQEPEDYQPKRKPQVKTIPIFEEENNSYVGCHITEINVSKSHKTMYDSLDYEDQHILKNPVVEAPSSLDYISTDRLSEDESLLTVHEKVHKFQNIVEDVNQIKPINKQVEKSDRPNEDFAENEHIYSTVKLAPSAPQISPELVRTISRHITRSNETNDEYFPLTTHSGNDHNEDYVECLANNKKLTKEFKVSHHDTTAKTAEKYQQPHGHDEQDDDELIPHTATHTTIIEERRQKDILNRPSVFDGRNKKPAAPTTTTTITTTLLKCNKSPVKDTEKLRPANKSRTKPTSSAVTHKPIAEQTTATTNTTTTITASSHKQPNQQQLPKRKNSDNHYELRGSNVETGVGNIISKQTKVYSPSSSGDSKTNDSKKPTQTTTSNKKPEKHMPVHLTPAKHSDERDLNTDDEMMIVTVEEATDIDIESQVPVNEDGLNTKTKNAKIPSNTTVHTSTNLSSPTDQLPLKTKTKEHLVKLTDKTPLKSNTTVTTTITSSKKVYEETTETPDDIDETVLEPATNKAPQLMHTVSTKSPKMPSTTTDSVAAKRNLFESNNVSSKRTPLTSPTTGKRPSYMDHTKSSLEHTRRDSIEINKTNYSRKPSHPSEEELATTDRNSMVKFDMPQGKRPTTPHTPSVTEDINVEEIFDLELLEQLLETIQSYEIRRRIRAQIRLIKKNQRNELISNNEVITKTTKTTKVVESEVTDATKPKPADKISSIQTTVTKENASHLSTNKKEYIFEEAYHPTSRRSPKPNRYPYEEEEGAPRSPKPTRSHSPKSPVGRRNIEHQRIQSPDQQPEELSLHGSRTTKQQYYYRDEHEEEEEEEEEEAEFHEVRHGISPTRKSPLPRGKPTHSLHSSPERGYGSPESRSPLKSNERSRSPQTKTSPANRTTSSRSPDSKTSATTIRKSSNSYEQQETMKTSTTTKPQTNRITTTTITTTMKSKPHDKTPIWADRKNILKTPSAGVPDKKPSSSTSLDYRSGYTKTSKSATSQKLTSNKSSPFVDDDSVISSYGIGPTDENGLPLFGIRALKKKTTTMEPSETTEEVTGYVVEEKYYSDNKSKPMVERKELIYSTNPEELEKLKEQVEVTTNRTALKDVDIKETRKAALISKGTIPALRSSPEDDFLDSTTKYVRRGSVKEMSEKFIQKEAASTVTEKSNNYPKAGLILRTNSHKSRDVDNENDNYESCKKTTRTTQQQHTSSHFTDYEDSQHEEFDVEPVGIGHHSGRFVNENEREEFKKVISSSSSSMATRSFLNSQGEEKVVTNVSDCLERMRNADNVVEEGDTAEDQEARALLNKFLGASIIMKGVESSIPATNRQSKMITTTTTSCNLNDDNDGDNNATHEVKSTRITKTINSGSSSTPVTYTTCAIEEIWDEEILKELLEQAKTYEERRKIRSRLRELMADREEIKKSPQDDDKASASVAANVPDDEEEEEESSASEYEEIIEEVTDYSEAESSEIVDIEKHKEIVVCKKPQDTGAAVAKIVESVEENCTEQPAAHTDQVEQTKTVIHTETVEVEEYDDKSASSDKGESSKPSLYDKSQAMPQLNIAAHTSNQSTNSQKLKSVQTGNSNNKSSSMYASCNSNKFKTQRETATTPTSNLNPVVTNRTAGRADFKSIHNNVHNSSGSGSGSGCGSLGGNSVVVGSNDSSRQVDRLGVPQKEDSGTESGEDLRLIAAGLRDQLQIKKDSNIIEDVTSALSRLENSLKDGNDIPVDNEKRNALLALVGRLRAGLTSPEKLAEIAAAMSELDANDGLYGETSSPEADAHRSSRSRFGKRKNRVNRHTVGVSREELADARRYMEDMLLMNNISQSTTPEANSLHNNTPPQYFPLEKNASTGTILRKATAPVLQRPKQFVSTENPNSAYKNRVTANTNKRRPLSGEYSVSFEDHTNEVPKESSQGDKRGSPEENSKPSRFTNKKHLMKRANTIDLAKTHKYNPEFDTDSDTEDKAANLGLKRAVQVSVKKRVHNVVPPFEPKTENDRKFLAFINKQSDRPGLGWTSSRSVSNWTNKFGTIKSTFEGGLVGKPPQPPSHAPFNSKLQQSNKLFLQPASTNANSLKAPSYITNQQIALRLQREADRQTEERRRKQQQEHLAAERRELENLEKQRAQHERQQRERLQREHSERQRREHDQIAAAQHAALPRQHEPYSTAPSVNAPQPIPINEFKHAPQSVFRPIENGDNTSKPIYKPIPQLPRNANSWQPLNAVSARNQANTLSAGNTRPDNSFITSPPPSSRSPIALPWASKPTVDSTSFKSKAHRFEERSKYDHMNNTTPHVHRHNSLRSSKEISHHVSDDFRKRPSLPNTFDLYSAGYQMPLPHDPLAFLPPPQNISFTYSSLKPKIAYQSYPCLPSAVEYNSSDNEFQRFRQDSLTDPHSVPLVLTSSNPSYCPPSQDSTQVRLQRQYDLVSPANSTPNSPSIYTMQQTDCTDDDELDSDTNLLEYHAVSRVMRKPQSQTAVTVGRRTGHVSDDELYGKNSRAAKTLLNTMKSIGNSNGLTKSKTPVAKRPEAVTSPKTCLSPDGRSYQAPIVEPLFPQINKFETNRKPVYVAESQKQSKSSYAHAAANSPALMYKSLENLNRTTARSQPHFVQQGPPPKSYVNETQTSYVVAYPIDDTTDDEDFNRSGQKKMMPPNTLEFKRHRKVSENSTSSSNTASMSLSQNLPSPNTSWTSNPIMLDEKNHNQNTSKSYQNSNMNVTAPSAPEPSSYHALGSHVTANYAKLNQNYKSPPTEAEHESSSKRHLTSMPSEKLNQLPAPLQQGTTMPISTSVYDADSHRRVQQNNTNQKQTPQHPVEVHQKSSNYSKQISAKPIKPTSATQDHQSTRDHRADQSAINPKSSNISPEMLMRLDQQRQRISHEERRKSLGNAPDYQMEQQEYCEAKNLQLYKSSAPSDTPDIVKSSLPKDETQPILKKFGPPQRHHYMPNSYQNPTIKTATSSTFATTSTTTSIHSNKLHSKNIYSTTKTTQQVFSNTRPTVVETPATPQPDDDYIPRNIVYNNVHAFSSMSRRQDNESSRTTSMEQHHSIRPSKLSKSDSWNQIMMLQSQHQNVTNNAATKFNQSPTNELRRTKSGHTLALPKMFEAAITKTDITEKQKTVAAYFSGQKSPTQQDAPPEQLQQTTKRSVINRIRTCEKASAASRKSLGSSLPIAPGTLQRSATMPHIANLNLLDESNVEDAFEQLIMEQKQQKTSSSTTEKTETKEKDGAVVTTTTKVTTRTVTGSAGNTVSPFAKFKQLDGQNSQQSAKSPTTTTTTVGGSTASPLSGNQPIFKFTDPTLNAKAATVKEQLLQWCQSKTQEYENIEITNFSTSWNNGLAFCALIHHFLPDAFDYNQLTPKNRRKNFELAFNVADEKAGIAPLLDVEDMVVMQRPDWKCVFVYVQSIYRRFRNCQ